MTGILIVLGITAILWKILVKVTFAENLVEQKFLPCPVTVSVKNKKNNTVGIFVKFDVRIELAFL